MRVNRFVMVVVEQARAPVTSLSSTSLQTHTSTILLFFVLLYYIRQTDAPGRHNSTCFKTNDAQSLKYPFYKRLTCLTIFNMTDSSTSLLKLSYFLVIIDVLFIALLNVNPLPASRYLFNGRYRLYLVTLAADRHYHRYTSLKIVHIYSSYTHISVLFPGYCLLN